ncbi:MAG TPA: hypothetical protein VGX51_13790 [Solirubrobacteraceae bacterium]|jgi:hypothetical protein|nr:hypothetical protein [Solirubrobacteraceae bacterium]
MSLLEEAIAAHGGMDRWMQIGSIDVALRCGGVALPLKGQPTILRGLKATVDTRRPHVQLHGIGTFDAGDPRPAAMARRFRWTNEDVVHFAGYALWGYMAAPFMFAADDFTVRELPRRRLRVDFPPRVPTHSRRQMFHFDRDAVLQRLDYTAEVMLGPFARAKHRCYDHAWIDGLLVPTRRRVTPRGARAPTLVSLDIDELRAG